MDVKALRDLTPEELLQKEGDLKKELFNLRFQSVAGRMESPSRMRQVRREIARVKTISCEKRSSGPTTANTAQKAGG